VFHGIENEFLPLLRELAVKSMTEGKK